MAAYSFNGPRTTPLNFSRRTIKVACQTKYFYQNFDASSPYELRDQLSVDLTLRASDPDKPATRFQFSVDLSTTNAEGQTGVIPFRGTLGSYEGSFTDDSPPEFVTHFDVFPFVKSKPGPHVVTRAGASSDSSVCGVEQGPIPFAWWEWVLSDPEDPESELVLQERQGRFFLRGNCEIKLVAGDHPDWHTYRGVWEHHVSCSAQQWETYNEADDEWLVFFTDYFEYRPVFSFKWVARRDEFDWPVTHAYALQHPGWFAQGPV